MKEHVYLWGYLCALGGAHIGSFVRGTLTDWCQSVLWGDARVVVLGVHM